MHCVLILIFASNIVPNVGSPIFLSFQCQRSNVELSNFTGLIENQAAPENEVQTVQVQQGTKTDIIPMSGNGLYVLRQIQHKIKPNNIESDVLELGQLQQDVKSHKVEDQVKLARFHLGK